MGILEALGIQFDNNLVGNKVAVIKAYVDYSRFLFEVSTGEEMMQILEEKKCESLW